MEGNVSSVFPISGVIAWQKRGLCRAHFQLVALYYRSNGNRFHVDYDHV